MTCPLSQDDVYWLQDILKNEAQCNDGQDKDCDTCEKLNRTLFAKAYPEKKRVPLVLTKTLGQGSFGRVFECINLDTKQIYAVKLVLSTNSKETEKEIQAQTKLGLLDISPKIYSSVTMKLTQPRFPTSYQPTHLHMIVMEKLQGTLLDFLLETHLSPIVTKHLFETELIPEILDILEKLRVANVTHGDLHWKNIGYVKKDGVVKVILLDFGQTRTDLHDPALDFLQLYRTLFPNFAKEDQRTQNMKRMLQELIHARVWRDYGINFPQSFEETQALFREWHTDYFSPKFKPRSRPVPRMRRRQSKGAELSPKAAMPQGGNFPERINLRR